MIGRSEPATEAALVADATIKADRASHGKPSATQRLLDVGSIGDSLCARLPRLGNRSFSELWDS